MTMVSKPELKLRVLRAGGWTIIGYALSQVLRLTSNLIMTRLLVPDMFGVMAVAQVFIFGLVMISDLGLTPSIVQSRRGDDPTFINTVWVVQILRGAFLWMLGLLLSFALHTAGENSWLPPNTAYADPRLPLVMAVLSFTFLLGGFESTKIGIARRQLSLSRITTLEIEAQLAAIAAMLLWTSFDRSIWALVAGYITGSATRSVLSHIVLPGPASKWQWEGRAFKEILGFGMWIFLTSILGFLSSSGDRLLLGGMVSAEILGFYSIAFLILSAIQGALIRLVSTVTFPALSEIARENPKRLREVYYKFRMAVDGVALFLSGFLFTTGSAIITVLFDSRYADAGPILEVLSLLLVMTRYELADQCYLALGRPKLMVPVKLTQIASLYLLIPTAFYMAGFVGAVWAIALASLASLPIIFRTTFTLGLIDWQKEILVLPAFLVGMSTGMLLLSIAS